LVNRLCCVVCLVWLSVWLSGCFDSGITSVVKGTLQSSELCKDAPHGDCPVCSTRDGAVCRDAWYSSGLRCGGDADCGAPGACQLGYCVVVDKDGDGLDDDFEREVAELNFPALRLATNEPCGSPHGVIYRVRRHPLNPKRLAITYTVLYDIDCGSLNGHMGDAESFAITVDLDTQPGAPATVGVAAWAHLGTTCGSTSSCETAAATGACGQATSASTPAEVVIWSSANKHANYLSMDTCNHNCLDRCDAGERINGPLLDVGQPGHPLVRDLTDQGFVQPSSGWADQLLHFDPWSTNELGGGGRLDKPLTDLIAPPGK
jgi:hypothetical protein